MTFFIETLPDVNHSKTEHGRLPRVYPTFSIRRLDDKPQDPITAAFSQLGPLPEPLIVYHDSEEAGSLWGSASDQEPVVSVQENIWAEAYAPSAQPLLRDQTLTWDKLRLARTPLEIRPQTPYLSELGAPAFNAARYQLSRHSSVCPLSLNLCFICQCSASPREQQYPPLPDYYRRILSRVVS